MIARSYFKKYDLNFQLLQFLMMNQQLAAQALQQPQINPFNQTQAVQLRGNFFTISFFFYILLFYTRTVAHSCSEDNIF